MSQKFAAKKMHALFTFCFFSPKIFVTPSFVTPFFTTLSQTSCHKIDATTTKSTALTFASSIRFYHRNQMRLTHIAFDSITEFQMRHKHIAFDPIRIQMRHRVDRDFAERGLQDGSIAGRGLQDSSIAGRGLQDVDCRQGLRAGTAGLISLQTFLLLQCRAIDYSQTRVPPKLHTTAFDLSTFRHP